MKNTGITYTSAERSPVILPEMAELLPPLSAEQLDALEADLIKNGCYRLIGPACLFHIRHKVGNRCHGLLGQQLLKFLERVIDTGHLVRIQNHAAVRESSSFCYWDHRRAAAADGCRTV